MTYTFPKVCNVARLKQEIEQSVITVALDYITADSLETLVVFKADLPYADQRLLNDLVDAHIATPLPDPDRIKVEPVAFPNPDGKRARLYGTHFMICAATSVTEQSYTLTSNRIMDGAEYLCKGGQLGDYVDFEVVHPSLGVLDSFCSRWYVAEGRGLYKLYPAFLPAGLSIRVRYTNTGAAEALLALNLFLHQP
jgi:hypothetical protein